MIYDRFMLEAIREVDALTPSVPPLMPVFVRDAYPYGCNDRDDTAGTFTMGNRVVTQEWYALAYPPLYDSWRRGLPKP